jgi:pimeloyl-ACP methyl ester carboxylesterase
MQNALETTCRLDPGAGVYRGREHEGRRDATLPAMNPPPEAVQTLGDGPDLVLIHGTASDASSWGLLARILRDRVRVTAYDRRGTARWPLDAGAAPPSVTDHVADSADIIRGLRTGPAYVCGLSFGAVIALELTRRRRELVRGVVLFEPAIAAEDHLGSVPSAVFRQFDELVRQGKGPQAAEDFHRRVLSERGWALLPPEAKEQARRLWRQIHWDLLAGAAYRPRYSELKEIDVPVLLLHGARSRPVFEASLRALDAALPRSERKLLEFAGHRLFGQAWPELAAVLTAFMGLSPAPRS